MRGEFDHAVVEYAQGKPLSEIPNASYVKDGKVVHNPSRPLMETKELDELPFATDVYQQNLTIENYNVPFLLNPFVSFYTTRGCPALCTFCLWPQTLSGHAWRTRSVENVAREFRQAHKMFPQAKEFFFDDDTFNIRKDRVLALCKEFKPVGFQWSCTARSHSDYETLKAMADAGCRLLIVGFESGDPQILKNIKKGATVEMGRNVHEELQEGRHSRSRRLHHRASRRNERNHRENDRLRQGTGLRDDPGLHGARLSRNGTLRPGHARRISCGRSHHRRGRPSAAALAISRPVAANTWSTAVNRFYDRYYFRPRVAWRIVRDALWDGHERKRLYHEAVDFMKLQG